MESEKSSNLNVASVRGIQGHPPNHNSHPIPSRSQTLVEINSQIAHFRDLLIQVGHDKHDSSDLRVQIRKTRRACVDLCTKASAVLNPQAKK
jgi:hypothetical protein